MMIQITDELKKENMYGADITNGKKKVTVCYNNKINQVSVYANGAMYGKHFSSRDGLKDSAFAEAYNAYKSSFMNQALMMVHNLSD